MAKELEQLTKNDINSILEVNRKLIEVELESAEQNEQILENLKSTKEKVLKIEEKVDKILKISEDMNKDIFKIQVLFVTGLLSVIIQIVNLLKK